ncbi:hypothetical protein [Undibacterium sp. Xuan67W]|uniref:hypothetical protein n=1 Tax=Undibacterium sp. Xuan67W TaxID=3413057 RepID=UPI003BF06528
MADSTKLSSSTSVADYKKWKAANDRERLTHFFVERYEERYFQPIDSSYKHGFTMLAVACLVIETLESFYQGLTDTDGKSKKMFRDFLARDTSLRVLGIAGDWFYKDIRCGILHQSESRGGWRILRSGPLLDTEKKAINASAILCALRQEVNKYAEKIQTDEQLWEHFCRKMDAVCKNC